MLQKPIFWISLIVIVIIGISILIFKPYSSKNLPSKVSEKPKPGNCLILPQEYCSQAEIIELDYQGVTYKFIGFNLPPGVPLFSPVNGNLSKTKVNEPSPVHGFLALAKDPNDPTLLSFSFYGDIKFDNMLSLDVKKGDIAGYTQDTGIKGLEDYNIVLSVEHLNPNKDGFITDEELLFRLFPVQ